MEKQPEHIPGPEDVHHRIDALKQKIVESIETGKYQISDYENIMAFAKDIERRRPDAKEYLIFQQLIGSSPPVADLRRGDFEGDDSVLKFLSVLVGDIEQRP